MALINKSRRTESNRFLKQSKPLETGNPSIHRLNLQKKYGENESFDQFTFGKKADQVNNKVILLLGATGEGKTTLINVMINYILGVKWEDRYRFKLIHEVTNKSQAESQTSVVTSYELYNQPGFQIPYSLTIIDTPGFGDTRGMAHDKLITRQLKEFLCHPLGIDHIDAVGFVVNSSHPRLTPHQKYIFDSILSIFGKDIAENILMLVTFVDGNAIPVLEAIKAADLPCRKNNEGLPIHFKFNNSSLYTQKTDDSDVLDGLQQIFWESGFKHMKEFFQALENIESKDLTLTKKVLEERESLEKHLKNLIPQITVLLSKRDENQHLKQCLEKEEKNMEDNKDFETEVQVHVEKRTKLNFFVTNCNTCMSTCHTSCFLPNEDDVKTCAVMDDDGNCVMCPGNCSYFAHDRERALWTYETKTEKRTVQEMKDNFMKAQGKFLNDKQILEKLDNELRKKQETLNHWANLCSNCLSRLSEIALKSSSLSTMQYISMLIKTEEDEHKPDFENRIMGLKKMKHEFEILDKIARGENLI